MGIIGNGMVFNGMSFGMYLPTPTPTPTPTITPTPVPTYVINLFGQVNSTAGGPWYLYYTTVSNTGPFAQVSGTALTTSCQSLGSITVPQSTGNIWFMTSPNGVDTYPTSGNRNSSTCPTPSNVGCPGVTGFGLLFDNINIALAGWTTSGKC